MKTTQFLDALHIFEVLQEKPDLCFIDAIARRINFLESFAPLFLRHVEGILVTRFAQHTVNRGDRFFCKLPTELDIHTAPCHVRGNGHRAKRTRAGDDLRFFRVLARIQHLVRNTALQHFLEAVHITFLQPQHIQYNVQVGWVICADIRQAIRLNEFAQRVRRNLFKRLVEGLKFGDDASIFFTLIGFHPDAADQGYLQQPTNWLRLEPIGK